MFVNESSNAARAYGESSRALFRLLYLLRGSMLARQVIP